MKKTILLLGLLSLFMGKSMAQNQQPLPDGKFEQWEQDTTYWGDIYDDVANPFWSSLNMIATLPPDMFTGPVTLFKDKGRSGAEGDFAPKMRSDTMRFGTDGKLIFLPGVVGALNVLVDEQSAEFGRPFVSRPAKIKGYMKYEPVDGDSASIFVEIYQYNVDMGIRQIIGKVEKFYKEPMADWTPFEIPIAYVDADDDEKMTPDSATVLFVSSAGYNFDDLFACQGQVGSTLWVDDVEFVYEADTDPEDPDDPEDPTFNENPVLASSKLYPNPSRNGIFNLSVKEACHIDVVSAAGMLMMQQEFVAAGAYTVDLSRFATGVYYIRLTNGQGSAVLKAIKR